MQLLSFTKLGEAHGAPRLWIESERLARCGFHPGTAFSIEPAGLGVRLKPAALAANSVSSRNLSAGKRPIIDVNNRADLLPVEQWAELKVRASFNQIDITPSVRGFHIRRRLTAQPPFDTLEWFAGGGLLSAAIDTDLRFKLVAGVEMEPKYADIWQRANPDALLIQADVRDVHPAEYPDADIVFAALPCTSHSGMGRAKKGLAKIPELGDTGDLYACFLSYVTARLPLGIVCENVPNFGNSLAGQTVAAHLQRLGYHVTTTTLQPFDQWNEPSDRQRWVLIATLKPGFELKTPGTGFVGTAAAFLDPADTDTAEEAQHIAHTLVGLRAHNARHKALGHGFELTTINRKTVKTPTLVRSYHKINVGPFVETEYGLRMLRQVECERLMGCSVPTDHYATAIEILGQGVQTRVFAQIVKQLGDFLCN